MKHMLSTLLLAIAASSAHADKTFTYRGKPIHPSCVAALVDISSREAPDVALSSCSKSNIPVHHEDGYLTTRNQTDSTQ